MTLLIQTQIFNDFYSVFNKEINKNENIEKNHSKFFEIKEGIKTADNERFVREWWTINNKDIYYLGTNLDEKKYIFTTKGGDYRKWYGNLNDLLFWEIMDMI